MIYWVIFSVIYLFDTQILLKLNHLRSLEGRSLSVGTANTSQASETERLQAYTAVFSVSTNLIFHSVLDFIRLSYVFYCKILI